MLQLPHAVAGAAMDARQPPNFEIPRVPFTAAALAGLLDVPDQEDLCPKRQKPNSRRHQVI
jgi:hypothetical protein